VELHLPLGLIPVLLLVLAAEFVNGWTDAPNAIATVVSTRVLSPGVAVIMAAVLNFVGALTGTAVAITIGRGFVDARVVDTVTVAAAMPIAPQPAVNPLLRPAQMRMINTINRDVNRDVRKATDFDLYGMIEYWSLPRVINGKMYGDCEDYALEKRRRLIEAGVPAESLSMAVAVTARGESHAVLVVSFESGDWVLDNLTPWAMPWEDMNYHWVQRQVAGSASWTTIG